MDDPAKWRSGMDSLKVGDLFTEEWLDRFRSLMTAHNQHIKDARRYRYLRDYFPRTILAEALDSSVSLDSSNPGNALDKELDRRVIGE